MFYLPRASTKGYLCRGSRNAMNSRSQVLREGSNCLTHAMSLFFFSAGTTTLL